MRLSELSRIYPFHFNCPHLLSTPIKSVLGRQSTEERTLGFVLWPPAAESSGSPREENTLLPGRSWTLLQFIYRQIRTGDTQGWDILNLHLHSTTTNSLFYLVLLVWGRRRESVPLSKSKRKGIGYFLCLSLQSNKVLFVIIHFTVGNLLHQLETFIVTSAAILITYNYRCYANIIKSPKSKMVKLSNIIFQHIL